jgi:hypothetical protein
MKTCRENPNLMKIWKKEKGTLMKTKVGCVDAGDIKST